MLIGCAKEKPTLNSLEKFFDCLGDSSKCEELKNEWFLYRIYEEK